MKDLDRKDKSRLKLRGLVLPVEVKDEISFLTFFLEHLTLEKCVSKFLFEMYINPFGDQMSLFFSVNWEPSF